MRASLAFSAGIIVVFGLVEGCASFSAASVPDGNNGPADAQADGAPLPEVDSSSLPGDGGSDASDASTDDTDPCGPDKALCTASNCPPSTCLAPSHVPKGFGTWSRDPALQPIVVSTDTTFDTQTGAAGALRAANASPSVYQVISGIGFVSMTQGPDEPPLAIWVFKGLSVMAGVLTFGGGGAVVLASAGSVNVVSNVTLDVGAKGRTPGPGGFVGGGYAKSGSGCAPGAGATSGAGGGAFGTGGATGNTILGGNAALCSAYAQLAGLRGGSGAGGADDSDGTLTGAFGGAGGGALQITTLRELIMNGIVNAGGGGRTPAGNFRNGAGGGSGGAIFLESPSLRLGGSAGLYANGGGAGSSSPGTGGTCGAPATAEDGKAALVPASGSHCGGGAGGNGAASTTAATAGAGGLTSGYGGGGGGLGRIVLKTLSAAPTVATNNLSPGPGTDAYVVLTNMGP